MEKETISNEKECPSEMKMEDHFEWKRDGYHFG
jgi:hypothetical protein